MYNTPALPLGRLPDSIAEVCGMSHLTGLEWKRLRVLYLLFQDNAARMEQDGSTTSQGFHVPCKYQIVASSKADAKYLRPKQRVK